MASGFTINNIELKNFRSYETLNRKFNESINKIVGPNATGKTNLLEAIGLITQIVSFRNAKTEELVCKNNKKTPTKIQAEIFDQKTDSKFEISLDIVDGKKIYKLNGKTKSISDCKGRFPSVVFNPDDLALVKGSNTMRRHALDTLGTQISRDYYTVLHDYNKALKQKNALLREGSNIEMLQTINDVLLAPAAQLIFYRLGLIQKILPVISNYYDEISGGLENLNVEYFPS